MNTKKEKANPARPAFSHNLITNLKRIASFAGWDAKSVSSL